MSKKEMNKNMAAAEAAATENIAAEQTDAEKLVGMAVIKKKGNYPIYAGIMCVGAAIGHTLGTYVFEDLMTWTAIGMGFGVLAAFLYSKKLAASADEKKEQ